VFTDADDMLTEPYRVRLYTHMGLEEWGKKVCSDFPCSKKFLPEERM
jgi:hypothetical protein